MDPMAHPISTPIPPAALPAGRRPVQAIVAGIAVLGLLVLAALSGTVAGPRLALCSAIGFAGGLALYHASFGFTSAWRRLLADRRTRGLRAQLLMIAVTAVVFFPLLARGEAFGQPLYGYVNSVGVALGVGAFLFGIGMQLGGGCGSGTLYTAGGGSVRMLVTLAAFVAGSLLATANPLSWMEWPSAEATSLVESLGGGAALIVALGLIAGVYRLVLRLERERYGDVEPLETMSNGGLADHPWLRGPWPLLAGALALALVNISTLLIAGRPWGITSAFALWGAKVAAGLGTDVANWPYWQGNTALSSSVFSDVTSVMNFGVMLGALAAAGLAGRFAPQARLPWRSLAAAVIGGLAMGFGARLATGCNIGAYFSGLASGSLHAVVWLAAAIPGNLVGMRLRPAFRLD